MSEQKFNFEGNLNGVKYTDPNKFVAELKKATAEGNVKSISYQYSSSSSSVNDEKENHDGCDCKSCSCNNQEKERSISRDSLTRVTKIKEIIQNAAEFSDEIFNSDSFTEDRLNNIRDVLRSSLQKIEYLISGMCRTDRADFCGKLRDGMRRLFEEAESESKDLIYEEAKYRQQLTEDNSSIEEKVEELQKAYDENCEEISWSYNRCEASDELKNFFEEISNLFAQE